MTDKEYSEAFDKLESDFNETYKKFLKDKQELSYKYLLSKVPYKVGDIVGNEYGMILITHITHAWKFSKKIINPLDHYKFDGEKLTKSLKPYKKSKKVSTSIRHITKVIKKDKKNGSTIGKE